MNTNMILPATIAAGLHAALFAVRFDPAPPPPSPPPERLEVTISMPPFVDDPPPVVRHNLDDPLPPPPTYPRQAENYSRTPIDIDVIKIPVPPIPPSIGPGINVIPARTDFEDGGFLTNGPIDIGFLDNQPRAIFRTAPKPPHGLRDLAASVTVEFIVNREGQVINVQIVDSTNSLLNDSCLRAVRRWRFEPGVKDNLPVPFRVQQTFVFTPRD